MAENNNNPLSEIFKKEKKYARVSYVASFSLSLLHVSPMLHCGTSISRKHLGGEVKENNNNNPLSGGS